MYYVVFVSKTAVTHNHISGTLVWPYQIPHCIYPLTSKRLKHKINQIKSDIIKNLLQANNTINNIYKL